jgi:hypothetical protein
LIAERMMTEADHDRDDFLSFDEFKNSLRRTDVERKMSIRSRSNKTFYGSNLQMLVLS